MNYTLVFYKKSSNPLSKEAIERYLSSISYIRKLSETRWVYQDKEIGSYCYFDYYNSIENTEIIKYNGYESVNFVFTINFIRPQFFGRACFTIVERLVDELDLYLVNPQTENTPIQYKHGQLFDEWATSNIIISKNSFKEFGLNYLDLEKSDYSYRYNMLKSELQLQLGSNYFVPRIFYIKKFNSNTVETLCSWTQIMPFVLPKVDFIGIQRKTKSFFSSKKENGLVSYKTLMDKFGSSFEKEGLYKIINTKQVNKIKKELNSLSFETTLDSYENISIDNFVNTKII